MANPRWKSAILKLLDKQARNHQFPTMESIEGYWHFGAAKLTSFRSDAEWLIVIDSIIYNVAQRCFDHLVYAFGNKVEEASLEDFWQLRQNMVEAPGHPIASEDDCSFLLNKFDYSLVVNGHVRQFTSTKSDYQSAGIAPDTPVEAQVLRLLVSRHAEELFLSVERLLELCGRAGVGLEEFVVLKEWHHPDVTGDEKPSDSSTFQMLATALAKGDPGLYIPDRQPNTHWSHWPTR